ncbi:hypothetical protein NFI08_14185 [Halomonas sp. EF61]|uniref:hypothetical protein n=1 Tax=Halomonas sp. EF61 TaxID=2950869 RepID=UPI0032DF6984
MSQASTGKPAASKAQPDLPDARPQPASDPAADDLTADKLTPDDLALLLEAVPEGYSEVHYRGRRYAMTRRTFNRGRSLKVFARELGGNDMVSLNGYLTARGWQLKPCEMSEHKVLDFLVHCKTG